MTRVGEFGSRVGEFFSRAGEKWRALMRNAHALVRYARALIIGWKGGCILQKRRIEWHFQVGGYLFKCRCFASAMARYSLAMVCFCDAMGKC